MAILTAFLLGLGIIKQVFKGMSFFALNEKCYNPDFPTFCSNYQVRTSMCLLAKGSVVSPFCPLSARDSKPPRREERRAGGNKDRVGATLCCCLNCLCSWGWRKTRRAVTLRGFLCIGRLWECLPWFIYLFNSVYAASWAPGSVGIGRWMRASSLSRQTESHREFLYDVTDGWRRCHG